MSDPDLEPEVYPTRAEMLVGLAWIGGPLGYLWIALKIAAFLFPDGNSYLLMARPARSCRALRNWALAETEKIWVSLIRTKGV
ncbi:MAG: hypothetical protein JSR81_09090 [Proteobacteria bacterium]|nr:hypothetical protein [Pseudomonadota bacterium]